MTDAERERITAAARKHAAESRQAQGLPATVTDPDALRRVVALMAPQARKAA